jgi:hypothetical protein
MPGSTTDTVPTMLTPGEFVIKRESAKMLGKPLLEKLNAISDNSAHSAIDSLISQATLSQMQPMMGGGVVNEYMGGGSVDNYMGGGMIDNYMYGGGVKKKKKKKMAGYQEGGDVNDLSPEDLAFMALGQEAFESKGDKQFQTKKLYPNLPGVTVDSYLSPEIVFGENYQNMSTEELDEAAQNFADMMSNFKAIATKDRGEFSPLGSGGRRGSKREIYPFSQNDAEALDALMFMLADPDKEIYKSGDSFKRLLDAQYSTDKDKRRLVKEFDVDDIGLQRGGAVGDATSVSLEGLMSELQKKNPISNYSMVDADRVDAENQEILDFIINSVMPGSAMGSIKQTGKLVPLAKKFASLAPDKGKQKVLDKIADEMTLPPSRKVMQNPSRNLYDYKDYKVLERRPESFDAMDLINRGYLQKYTNKLIRNMNPSSDVKLKDIVDSRYYNINEATRNVLGMPKKERMKAAKDLLKMFDINLRKVKGKQEGGEVADSLFGMSMDEFNKILANELLESSMTGENTPMRIELSPEEDRFRNNPNPDKPFGMTILDDLLLRAYEQYKFGRLPSMKD